VRIVAQDVASGEPPSCWLAIPSLKRELGLLFNEQRREEWLVDLHERAEPDIARACHDFYEYPLARAHLNKAALDLYVPIVRRELDLATERLRKEKTRLKAQIEKFQARLCVLPDLPRSIKLQVQIGRQGGGPP
jgi:hypothetical protein